MIHINKQIKTMVNPFEFRSGGLEEADLSQANERAEKILVKNTLNPGDFRDIYSNGVVDQDLSYVRSMEQRFARQARPELADVHQLATILEAMIHEQAELNEWLGPGAMTIKASRFDDIAHGIDTVVEFRDEDAESKPVASYLAIDITSSGETGPKLDRIKKEIKIGQPGELKYFASEYTGARGTLFGIPKVIIGVDRKRISDAMYPWLAKNNAILAEHPVQIYILQEIIMQLKKFEAYAKANDQLPLAAKYREMSKIIEAVNSEKGQEDINILKLDKVFFSIHDQLKTFG